MELTDIILLASSFVLFPTGYLIGVNHKHYRDAINWIETHDINISHYKERIKKEKIVSFKRKIDYYLGYPGRALAFRKIKMEQ